MPADVLPAPAEEEEEAEEEGLGPRRCLEDLLWSENDRRRCSPGAPCAWDDDDEPDPDEEDGDEPEEEEEGVPTVSNPPAPGAAVVM